MQQLMIRPVLFKFDACKQFCDEFKVGKGDLIITNEYIYNPNFSQLQLEAAVVFQEKYGQGEPSDEMAEKIYADIKDIPYTRVIAVGGGTVIDISKLFALKQVSPVVDLFDHKLEIVKDKKLILVPTTCGTGSEVTNISILALTARRTKLGLAADELYADAAVLIPELLQGLPFKFFATSSIDALIHAFESAVSPKATPYTELFSYQAIKMILRGYQEIVKNGPEARLGLLEDFLLASNYAGIAFGNAGCGAVHAMSYPLGAQFHVPHGEANYAIFTEVFKTYHNLNPYGRIAGLTRFVAQLLDCEDGAVYEVLETLLNHILCKKALHAYGVAETDLAAFTENVMTKQGRLMANNYETLDQAAVYAIYRQLF